MAEEKARDPTKPEIKPVSIPLSKIHDLPGSVFAPPSSKSLEALTSSIVLKGVQEPVILRQREDGEFQIVSGNRRRKASEFAKKMEIPAFVYDMGEREAEVWQPRGANQRSPLARASRSWGDVRARPEMRLTVRFILWKMEVLNVYEKTTFYHSVGPTAAGRWYAHFLQAPRRAKRSCLHGY